MATLQKLIESEIGDFFAGFGSPGEPESPADMQSQLLARISPLLASMEQEPVAWQWLYRDKCHVTNDPARAKFVAEDGDVTVTPLYAAPQLPQPAVMDDEQSKRLFDEWSGGDAALGELRSNGVPDEFISMLKDFSLATWEACREAMVKQTAQFIVTSDHRMMEMPKNEDIDAVAAMFQGAEPVSQPYTLRDGWVAVPLEPTEKMVIEGFESVPHPLFQPADWDKYQTMSGCEQAAHRAKLCWAAMIAAAPQQEV